jgi:hypothetical protein
VSEFYVLDANTFIQPKRRFYPFDICPGYWKSLAWHQQAGRVVSIDRVYHELERGADELSVWARDVFTAANFKSTQSSEVARHFGDMLEWVRAQPHFLPQARQEFASAEVADGWIAAFAKSNPEAVVVTLEEFNSERRRRVPLPNVCTAFDLEWITPFEMLKRLAVALDWSPPP